MHRATYVANTYYNDSRYSSRICQIAVKMKKTGLIALLVGITVAGTAAGVAGTYLVAPRWPASLLIGIGQIGREPLVDPGALVQRVNFKGFALETLKAAGLPEDPAKNATSGLVIKSLRGTVPKGGLQYVELSVEAYSHDDARKVLEAALSIVQSEHLAVLQPGKQRLQKNLEDVQKTSEALMNDRAALLQRVRVNGNTADRKFSENVLLSGLITSNDTELRALRDRRRVLEEQLDPSRTFNTRALAPIYLLERPTTPRRLMGAFIGFLIGLAAAIVVLLTRDPALRKTVIANLHESGLAMPR